MRTLISATGLLLSKGLFSQEPGTANEDAVLGPVLVPEPVGFSFEAPGWYVLMTVIAVLAVIALVRWLLHYRKNAYRRDALKELDKISDTNELLILLKLVSLKTYGRSEIAALSGKEWLSFLETKGKNTPYTQFEKEISSAVYRDMPVENNAFNEISSLSKRWIKTHA